MPEGVRCTASLTHVHIYTSECSAYHRLSRLIDSNQADLNACLRNKQLIVMVPS